MLADGEGDRRRRAADLTELWGRLSRQHLTGGQGCGCSFGGLMFQASDFELDIVEFVIAGAEQAHLPGAVVFVDAVSRRGPDRYSLPALLKALAEGDHRAATPAEIDCVIERLNVTLSNIDRAHAKGRFACD
ncbi:MAG: hypothetical protein JWL93_1201 [Hyphomicrobiales bacterium]|nr:hypothetical protein [Hyphomicrobiales bacterium]